MCICGKYRNKIGNIKKKFHEIFSKWPGPTRSGLFCLKCLQPSSQQKCTWMHNNCNGFASNISCCFFSFEFPKNGASDDWRYTHNMNFGQSYRAHSKFVNNILIIHSNLHIYTQSHFHDPCSVLNSYRSIFLLSIVVFSFIYLFFLLFILIFSLYSSVCFVICIFIVIDGTLLVKMSYRSCHSH